MCYYECAKNIKTTGRSGPWHMANTILNKIASFLPRHEIEKLAEIYHVGQKFRSYTLWSQFMAMLIGQVTGRKSKQNLESNLIAQQMRCYPIGAKCSSRATLARVNERQTYELYRELFYKLLPKWRKHALTQLWIALNTIMLLNITRKDSRTSRFHASMNITFCPVCRHIHT